MQDIGGCRAIMPSLDDVLDLRALQKRSDIKHTLVREKNYINNPRDTGYRGIHLIYSYKSDKMKTWNGLLIEMQIRTRIQHIWATAVEAVDTFLDNALKSGKGDAEWHKFFVLMSDAMSRYEVLPPLLTHPPRKISDHEELRFLAIKLDVIRVRTL